MLKLNLKLIFIILFFFNLLLKPVNIKQEIDADYLIILIMIITFSLILHILFMMKETKNWFRLDFLFLVSMFISFYFIPILYFSSGFFPDFYYYPNIIQYVNYSTWLVNMSLFSWLIGFHFFYNKYPKTCEISFKYDYKIYLYISIISFIMFYFIAGSTFFSGEYTAGENLSTAAKYIYSIFSITIILTTMFIFLNYKNHLKGNIFDILKINKLYLILIIVYLYLFVIITSDRGSAIQLISAFLFIYATLIKPITGKQIFMMFFIGSIFFSIIGLGRNSGADIVENGFNNFSEKANSNNIPILYTLTKDLSATCRIFYRSVEYIDNGNNHLFGKSMISPILASIPFANSFFREVTDLKGVSLKETNTSSFITYIVLGNHSTWGEGSNLLADIYINFSEYGLILIFFLLGILFKKLYYELIKLSNIKYLIISTMIVTFVIYWPRAPLLIVLKPIIWSMIIFTIFSRIKIRK